MLLNELKLTIRYLLLDISKNILNLCLESDIENISLNDKP